MQSVFEARFKPAKDSHALLAQFTHTKKDSYEPMQDFIAKFKNLIHKIPELAIPILENQKCFFINIQPPNVSFLLWRFVIPYLSTTQATATEIEGDLILDRKIRRELSNPKN